jgi:ABC-type sulfate transport system substrate-binding protein
MEAALIVIAVVVILAALSMEMKLARANRIARASHDILKEMLALQKKAAENAERETHNGKSRTEKDAGDTPAAPDVYRL